MNAEKKQILIITTGGTIAMRYEQGKGVVPTNSLVEFLSSFPQLNEEAEIEVLEFSNIPSPHMTPAKMFELAQLVDLKSVDYHGIVITHGTDTLEETAYLLDLVLTTRRPVVLTAAMRSGSDLGLDGPRNIVGAVRVACSDEAIDQDVFVVMNDEIHSARDVIKSDTGKLNSFVSPQHGVLGLVDSDRVLFFRRSMLRENVWTDKIDERVDLIRCVTGMDGKHIRCSIEQGARGLIIEAMGRGNVPPAIVPAIADALVAGIVVVVVSRAYNGRVLPEYGYEGGGMALKNMGCILGGDLKGPKARLKLMALLGKFKDSKLVTKFFPARLD